MKYKKVAIIADSTKKAQGVYNLLTTRYSFIDAKLDPTKADAVIVLSGDGFMLHNLHKFMEHEVPLYGINCGTYGFLLNRNDLDNLQERLQKSHAATLHPLEMEICDQNNVCKKALAFNEVSLLRETYQTANISIIVDGVEQINKMVCDGVIVATPAGSSAYNMSANGPVIPLSSKLLALTPISPFRPRRWKGALLPSNANIELIIQNPKKRPVSAVADFNEFRNVKSVKIRQREDIKMQLLFDPEYKLEDRLIKEQFIL